ncbi:MAG: TldD/PmbA family protein [Bdellovibrionaceae bacterium]|nr:TldD/PmbA family protein [Pseudobdellovibrionaceae bacterium]
MKDLESLLKPIKHSADWVGLSYFSEKATQRKVVNEICEPNFIDWNVGIRVEVFANGQYGYSGTSDTSPDGIQAAFEKALELTKVASEFPVCTWTVNQRPASRGQYRSHVQKSLDNLGEQEALSILRDCSLAMKVSEKIKTRIAEAKVVEIQSHSLGSNGKDIEQAFSMVYLSFAATAVDGDIAQTRTQNGPQALCYQIGSELFSRHRLLPNCEILARQALELVSADDLPNGKMDLILAPDQMMLQIHESVGHPLELDRILGDERNYAGSSFVRLTDFGTLQYGSHLMNIVFDPSRFGELGSYGFDESGLAATREYLIQGGVLLRGLGGLESQSRSGISGVANFRSSSWNRPPIDRMANVNLERGVDSLDDMIAAVESGVIMHSNRSFSIDDTRNKFQFGCEYAQLIQDGRITQVLKNPNYRGTSVPFWRKLKRVSAYEEVYGTPWCGKGEPNQIIFVGHSSPYCLFEGIDVFGGSNER